MTLFLAFLILTILTFVVSKQLCLYGVNYKPARGDGDGDCKDPDTIKKELTALKTVTSRIRIYSLTKCDQARIILQIADELQLKVWLGMWVGNDQKIFDASMDALQGLVNQNLITSGRVIGLTVGSEVIFRHEADSNKIKENIQKVRDFLNSKGLSSIALTYADIFPNLMGAGDLASAVDVISVNDFPFWEKVSVDGSGNQMVDRLKPLVDQQVKQSKKQQLLISETGWATSGNDGAAGEASPDNEAKFIKELYCTIHLKQKWRYFYFQGFDLQNASPIEGSFGLFEKDSQQLKPKLKDLKFKCDGSSDEWSFGTEKCPGANGLDEPSPMRTLRTL